jgi:hypothetical protein
MGARASMACSLVGLAGKGEVDILSCSAIHLMTHTELRRNVLEYRP